MQKFLLKYFLALAIASYPDNIVDEIYISRLYL